MNYRLSVGVNRPLGKSCFVIESNGEEVKSKVFTSKEQNIKKEVLNAICSGLLACRSLLKHEDSLIIEVQNRHLYQWLAESVDYKGYEAELDSVHNVLDTIDCKYRFVFNSSPYAKMFLERNKKSCISGGSIADMI